MAIRTIDVSVLTGETGSLFETVAILAKRARQISAKGKAELDEKLSYFEGFGSEIEDTRMTEEQVRTSVDYEKRAKPPEVAINEMMNREIYFRNPNEEETL
ncbi:MAG: DNA-directed RNA polymerase subunit omega [Rhodothermales bacterium]|nr:DNA-directed RNA polymerase subunit omega [Rhodothermales bacterium]